MRPPREALHGGRFRPKRDASSIKPPFHDLAGLDPLADDAPEDVPLTTTARGLLRIVTTAADLAARFATAPGVDPVAWMLAPRLLFDGRTALEACLELRHFQSATLFSCLLLERDVEPDRLRDLAAVVVSDPEDPGLSRASETAGPVAEACCIRAHERRLFTCFVEGPAGRRGLRLQAFCAMTAAAEDEVRARLGERYGTRLARSAAVLEGCDDQTLLADLLVSDAMARLLARIARDPSEGVDLDLVVEQRFRP